METYIVTNSVKLTRFYCVLLFKNKFLYGSLITFSHIDPTQKYVTISIFRQLWIMLLLLLYVKKSECRKRWNMEKWEHTAGNLSLNNSLNFIHICERIEKATLSTALTKIKKIEKKRKRNKVLPKFSIKHLK